MERTVVKTLYDVSPAWLTRLLRTRTGFHSVRGRIVSVWFVMFGIAFAAAAIPLHSAIASDVRNDRFWELELRGTVQSFNPSRLTIEVDGTPHLLYYGFQVIREGRVVDAAQVESGSFVILDKRDGSVRRIFLMEAEPR